MNSSPLCDPPRGEPSVEGRSQAPGALDTLVRTLGGRSLGGLGGMAYDLDPGSLAVCLAADAETAGWSRVVIGVPAQSARTSAACATLPVEVRPSPTRTVGGQSFGLDHVAIVVDSLEEALADLATAVPAMVTMRPWEFPELRSTAVGVLLDGCYLELNQPWDEQSFFTPVRTRERARIAFVCIRVADLERSRAALERSGIAVGKTVAVHARPVGTEAEVQAIGRVAGLRKSATGGLPTMLIQTAWPWDCSTPAFGTTG